MAYLYVNFYNDNNNFKLVFLFQTKHQIFQVEKMRPKDRGREREERKHARNVKLKLRKAKMDGRVKIARVKIYIL